MNINTGSYVSLAGLVVMVLGLFHVTLLPEQIETVIAGGVALYGIIHQIFLTKKVVKEAAVNGVQSLKGI